MFFQLQIISKDKKVLKNFLKYFYSLQQSSSTWNVISQINKCEKITVLKSPHINKTAQEQFEYRTYSKKIIINSFKSSIFLVTLKKIKGLSFPGLVFKVTGILQKKGGVNTTLKILNPKNIIFKLNFKESKIEILKYLQLCDCYGEMFVKTKCFYINEQSIFSSVG